VTTEEQDSDDQTPKSDVALQHPIEAKMKENERKKACRIPAENAKAVEDHYDDLGDDLSGLGGDLVFRTAGIRR
jgi:hypothetical protein